MAKGFEKYYAATRDGVVRVQTRAPIVARGVVLAWQCTNLDKEVQKGRHFLNIPNRLLFDDPEAARKATFKLKLKEAQDA